jgi:hypothetical protein
MILYLLPLVKTWLKRRQIALTFTPTYLQPRLKMITFNEPNGKYCMVHKIQNRRTQPPLSHIGNKHNKSLIQIIEELGFLYLPKN